MIQVCREQADDTSIHRVSSENYCSAVLESGMFFSIFKQAPPTEAEQIKKRLPEGRDETGRVVEKPCPS